MRYRSILDIGDDPLAVVLSLVRLSDLSACARVCRQWFEAFQDETLWNLRLRREYTPEDEQAAVERDPSLTTKHSIYVFLVRHGLQHRFSLLPQDRNPETKVAEDGSWAEPDNGSWNLILGEHDIPLGRRFCMALKIERPESSLTFRIGFLACDRQDLTFRQRLDDTSRPWYFWGTNEYLMAHSPEVPSSRRLNEGQFFQPNDVLAFELGSDRILKLYTNGTLMYTFRNPIDLRGKSMFRLAVQLSGRRLRATFVPFDVRPDAMPDSRQSRWIRALQSLR